MVERYDVVPRSRLLRMAGFAEIAGLQSKLVFAFSAFGAFVGAGVAAHAVGVAQQAVVGVDTGPVRDAKVAVRARASGRDVDRRLAGLRQTRAVATSAHGDAGLRVVELGARFPLRREFVVAGLALVAGG